MPPLRQRVSARAASGGWPGPDPDRRERASPGEAVDSPLPPSKRPRPGGWRRLLRRLLPPASVRQERRELGARLERARQRIAELDPAAREHAAAQARQLAEVREEIGSLTGAPDACRTCATRLPGFTPGFPGGFCCGGGTAGVTPERELIALGLAGARLDRQRVTRDHQGCIFRAPTGCTLSPRDRPSLCVAYLCTELRAELHRRGTLPQIVRLGDTLASGLAEIDRALGEPQPTRRSAPDGSKPQLVAPGRPR